MNAHKYTIPAAVIIAALSAGSAQALTVATTANANTLAGTILGPGISIVPGSASYVGGSLSSGTYSGGTASGIGINSGIILTTGNANSAPGPNLSDSTSGSSSGLGDSDLDGLVGGGTDDATILQFDFTTAGGDLFFNYVFASEEYNEYVNSGFNDVFGFFLDNVNIALIPSTSTPVAIDTVNQGSNSSFYNNNDPSNGIPTPYNIQYDGFTDVFTATALGLSAGTHHIKLAISDRNDQAWDSAVFIQANSFSDTPTDPNSVPEGGSLLWISAGVMAGLFRYAKSRKVS